MCGENLATIRQITDQRQRTERLRLLKVRGLFLILVKTKGLPLKSCKILDFRDGEGCDFSGPDHPVAIRPIHSPNTRTPAPPQRFSHSAVNAARFFSSSTNTVILFI